MPEFKFDGKEFFSTAEFHADRAAADHLHEAGHVPRLYAVAAAVNALVATGAVSVIDYGCGSGGLLSLIAAPEKRGYDFQPDNVRFAQELGRPVEFKNFVDAEPEFSDVAVLSEVLEHMDDPHGFLGKLNCRVLVASVPLGETPQQHYELHRWGWCMDSFREMLKAAGFTSQSGVNVVGTQVWTAVR